jgi:hypothetical protein
VKIYLKSDFKRVEAEYAALATAEARRLYVEERTKAGRAIAQVISTICGLTLI